VKKRNPTRIECKFFISAFAASISRENCSVAVYLHRCMSLRREKGPLSSLPFARWSALSDSLVSPCRFESISQTTKTFPRLPSAQSLPCQRPLPPLPDWFRIPRLLPFLPLRPRLSALRTLPPLQLHLRNSHCASALECTSSTTKRRRRRGSGSRMRRMAMERGRCSRPGTAERGRSGCRGIRSRRGGRRRRH
jgi:hypothetical protein